MNNPFLKNNTFGRRDLYSGFTLVEVLIGSSILLIVIVGIYSTFVSVIKTVQAARIKTDAMLLANEQIEVIRNLPYQDVGIENGVPVGVVPRIKTLTRGGSTYNLVFYIRNVDDVFDGTLGSTTHNDLAPADYKQIEIDIGCATCRADLFPTSTIITSVAPRNLETTTGNGSLIIKTFDSNGDPVGGAGVHIVNNSGTTTIDISEITDNEGVFQLIDTPPGALVYQTTVSKAGYSTDGTVVASVSNPNPLNPPSTVAAGQVTQLSFAIDKLSDLTVNTVNRYCDQLAGQTVGVVGQKKIGQNPDVFKYDKTFTSNDSGLINLSAIEWDTYNFNLATSSGRYLAGSLPPLPVLVSPDTEQTVTLMSVTGVARGLLVIVLDAATGLPLSGATVKVGSETQITNQGFFNQTDWSGGSGQFTYDNQTMFADTDGNIDYSTLPGELRLRSSLGQYLSSGYLISSVFDTNSTSTEYTTLTWSPADQATSTGANSVRVQIATGDDGATTTWNFIGPDGTTASYYTEPNSIINTANNNHRYLRYKLYLSTADVSVTPNISDLGITYTTACIPPGQAYFDDLSGLSQDITVTRDDYQSYSSSVATTEDWQAVIIRLEAQ